MMIVRQIKNLSLEYQTYRKVFDVLASILLSILPVISINVPNGHETGMLLYCWACIIAYILIRVCFLKRCSHNISIVITKLDILIGIFFLYVVIRNSISLRCFDLNEFLKLSSGLLLIYIAKNMNRRSMMIVYLSLILSVAIQAILSLLQTFKVLSSNHGIFLSTGSFDNPAINGIFIASVFPLILGVLFYTKRSAKKSPINTHRYALYSLLWCMLMAIASSASRSAWIGVIFSSAIILLKFYAPTIYPLLHNRKRTIYSICVVSIIVFFILLYYFKPISANSRLYIWIISLKVFLSHPLWGVGNSYSYHFLHQQAEYFLQNPDSAFINMADNIHHSYNVFIQILSQYGLIGFILCCGIIIVIYKCRCRSFLWIIKIALLEIMIEGCFSFAVSSYSLLLIISLYIGLIDRCMPYIYKAQIDFFNKTYLRMRIIYGITLCVGCVLLFGYAYSTLCWSEGMIAFEKQEYDKADRFFSRANFMLKSNGYFWNIRGKCLSLQNKYIESNEIMAQAMMNRYSTYSEIIMGDNYLALGQYEKAKQAYMTAHRILPSKMYPLYLLSICLYKEGNIDEFKKTANVVLNMPVKVHSTATVQMQNRLSTILNQIHQ